MKKYLVELDENLVKYINYLQQDVECGCLTSNEEYLNGYEALLSQLSNNLECVDDSITYFTEEELKMIHDRMEVEQMYGIEVYTQEELDTMKSISTIIEGFKGMTLNFGIKPTAQIITPVNKREYDQAQLDNAIEIANEELAECIGIIRNYTNVHDLYDNANKLGLCLSRDSYGNDYVTIYYKSVKFDVINCSDGSGIYIAADKIEVKDENKVTIWTGVLTEEGVPGVASQDEANIYLQPDEPTDEEVIDALKKEQTDILCNNYPLGGDGMYCYYVNSEYYVSVIVEHEWDMFAWRIYTKNGGKDKLIASDFSCGLNEDTWLEVFSTDICGFTGTIEAMIELPSSIFNHVINA